MRTQHKGVMIAALLLTTLTIPVLLSAQEQPNQSVVASTGNPVPLISLPLVPDASRPGAAGFTLVVNGTGFVAGSVVKWNGSARATTFVSGSQLTAAVLASDIATAGAATITVFNPSPGGGTSNSAFFEIKAPLPALLMSKSGYATGSGTQGVTAADLNGDGKLDLVVANLYSNTVTVLLGNGNGTFKPGVDYSTGLNPTSVAVGDVNGDGKLDLVVAAAGGPSVSVLLGNGDGTFQVHSEYPTGSGPLALALGDFNRDGKLDVVTANNGSNLSGTVSVLLGNGDGTFKPHVDYGTGKGPWSVAVGDFNKDGNLDLAVANYVDWTVSVLLGNSDGSFRPQVAYATGRQPISVAVGDLTRDGKLDLAVANYADNTVSVLRGNGDGTFQPHVDYAAGWVPFSVVMADFNGDNKVDLAVANDLDQTVSILLGNGDGTFQGRVNYVTGSNPQALAVGDFNRDGWPDLAVANYSFSGPATVSVLLATGTTVTLSINGLTFATQLLDTTSAGQSITLTNHGSSTLSVASITVTGANPQDFSQTNNCGTKVAVGASCTMNVAFRPTQVGVRIATLAIADNAPASPQTVSLSGTSTEVLLNPTSLSFVCTPIFGSCSCTTQRTTKLTNVGSAALDISSITVSGAGFHEISNTCATSVGSGQSCAVTVGWSRVNGSGKIYFSDDGGASPQTVSLSGVNRCGR